MAKKDQICAFCGRNASQVQVMISGPDVNICDRCVQASRQIIIHNMKQHSHQEIKNFPIPAEIKERLDQYVIGQDLAKKKISVVVYNHYKRINSRLIDSDVELEKSNILLIGPTGTGKTLIAESLARFLQVPFAIADATTLTEAGYVGEDVENVLVRLLQAADYDLAAAEMGIIYIDELDKIARKEMNMSITRDVSGEGVQQALLKLLEGSLASVPPEGGRKHPEQKLININTKNILFICGGAFEGIRDIIGSRIGKNRIGFGDKAESAKSMNAFELLLRIEPDDLLQFGLIPELIGRLPIVCPLGELDEAALMKILSQPRNALVKQYQRLMEMEGVALHFEREALKAIVKEVAKKRTGARALRGVMERVMCDIMFDIPSRKDVAEVIITKGVVTGRRKPRILTVEKKKRA
ncbi:MAG: ATP-dependent Clp protease ATP-binding subunit ClpX [candidate division Zixibacteria bacterium]|nr:ATP-dependent Clp protease ATP-binding subunit ClpX [Candidatus Tariuqbacter arcticus]